MSGCSRRRVGQPGTNGGNLSVGEVDLVDQRRQPRDVDRPVARDTDRRSSSPNCCSRKLRQRRRALGGHFEPHGEAELALRQFALQRLAQILHFFLVDEQIAVARDAELVVADPFPRTVHRYARG